MRKVFFLLFILMFAISCSNDEDEKADISINSSHIMHNGHEFVDLGLPSGLLWATCNVGAYSPSETGGYYAWGETKMKEVNNYTYESYKWDYVWDYVNSYEFSKYNTSDKKNTLENSDDVATVLWGSGCRIPTYDEYKELYTNCTWTKVFYNNIYGYIIEGHNGNFIFLPAAGRISYVSGNFPNPSTTIQAYSSVPYYWSSSLVVNENEYAYSFSDSYSSLEQRLRTEGLTIRPVLDK